MMIGETIIMLEEIGSTNDYAKELADKGAKNGTVLWAKRQTAGRGTHGRTFVSLEGNVFWSVILKPVTISFKQSLVYSNALAVYNTIDKFIDERVTLSIKWPNDILLNEKKISGSLLETGTNWIVIGTGINVIDSPGADTSMIYPPTSLKEYGYEVTREAVITELNIQLEHELHYLLHNGFSKLRDRYLEKAFKLHEELSVRNRPDKTDYVTGTYLGIGDDGSLLLKRNNRVEKIFSGTVISQ